MFPLLSRAAGPRRGSLGVTCSNRPNRERERKKKEGNWEETSPEPLTAFNQSRHDALLHLDRPAIASLGREAVLQLIDGIDVGVPDHEAYWIIRRHGSTGINGIVPVLSRSSIVRLRPVYALGVTFKTVDVYASRSTSFLLCPCARVVAEILHSIYKPGQRVTSSSPHQRQGPLAKKFTSSRGSLPSHEEARHLAARTFLYVFRLGPLRSAS